jgi:hypothetical protein
LGIGGLQEPQEPTVPQAVVGTAPVSTSTAVTPTSAVVLPAEPIVSVQPAPPVSVTTTPAAPSTTVQWTPQVIVQTTTAPTISAELPSLPSRTVDPKPTASAAPTTHKVTPPTTPPTRHKGPRAGSAPGGAAAHDAHPAESHPIKTKLG